jgi:hypothetical protein
MIQNIVRTCSHVSVINSVNKKQRNISLEEKERKEGVYLRTLRKRQNLYKKIV